MAQSTVKDTLSIHGTNPQTWRRGSSTPTSLSPSTGRRRVLAELVLDKAMELKYVGGVYGGNIKPTPFLCLMLKIL
uniref:Pre-mRNA-splicing factor 38B n=1 Tax=Cyanoderma ruficeps TaxID=181631 RepID=A0A8C3QUE5_9PASS